MFLSPQCQLLNNEDLLERKTILSYRADAGYITGGDAPFFERFYGGGLGSIRGFRYRGISPRSGPEDDPIGGNFSLTGSVELNFPIASELLRGVSRIPTRCPLCRRRPPTVPWLPALTRTP